MYPAILVFAFVAAQQTDRRNVTMDFAENSWPSVITEGGSVILVGQIRKVEGPHLAGVNQQTGTVMVHVIRALSPQPWQGPPELSVGFTQLASEKSRFREGNGGWNGVDVKPGALLLMGLASGKIGAAPASLEAVSQISSTEAPQVAAIVQALHIEATDALGERKLLLKDALNSSLPVLQSYAQFALGRKQRIPRTDAAELEISSLLDGAKPETQRLSAESTLELELWNHSSLDDSVNKSIVAALIQVLARREPGMQRSSAIALSRVLLSYAPSNTVTAKAYRSYLLQDIQPSEMKAVQAALREAESDPNVRSQASQLIETFSEFSR